MHRKLNKLHDSRDMPSVRFQASFSRLTDAKLRLVGKDARPGFEGPDETPRPVTAPYWRTEWERPEKAMAERRKPGVLNRHTKQKHTMMIPSVRLVIATANLELHLYVHIHHIRSDLASLSDVFNRAYVCTYFGCHAVPVAAALPVGLSNGCRSIWRRCLFLPILPFAVDCSPIVAADRLVCSRRAQKGRLKAAGWRCTCSVAGERRLARDQGRERAVSERLGGAATFAHDSTCASHNSLQ